MFSHVLLDALFVLSVVVIWFMLAYQFLLSALGWLYSHQAARECKELALRTLELPRMSVLIPAHNEEVVLDDTLRAMAALQYPAGRIEIVVINDASADCTGEIADRWAACDPRIRVIHLTKAERAGGKSAALNRGMSLANFENIAIYDADNTPEPMALLHLGRQLAAHPELGAVIGVFRCVNRKKNLLTRMINIEGLSYQWIVQAGRWVLMRVCTLPGTNLVIRRELLESLGGWDPNALTEDAELSIQIYEAGYKIKIVPYAVTWEQEPETLATWFRQRTRWARGNNYLVAKHASRLLSIRPKRLGFELLYNLSLYYIFFTAILVSDLLFLLNIVGLIHITVTGPFYAIWLLALGLFTAEVTLALSQSEGEDTFLNLLFTVAAYFTYCQLWIPVVIAGLYDDYIAQKARVWAKTERFKVEPPPITTTHS